MKSSFLILILLTTAAVGQPRHARFLALGDAPPFRQEIRDGVRYELEPPEGAIPPREIMVGGKIVKLRLGMVGSEVTIPAGQGPLELRNKESDEQSKAWLRVATPEAGNCLVLIWRDAAASSWADARALALPDDPITAAAGTARFVNVSPFEVRIALGAEKLVLAPGKTLARLVPTAGGLPFQVFLQDRTGELKRMFSSSLTGGSDERTLVVLYRADGKSPRRPLKVIVRRESPTVPVHETGAR